MKRGELWWADLPSPIGKRPVLLLSREKAYAVRNAVTIAIVTRTVRNIPVEVKLGPDQGLPKPCVVNLDDILTVAKALLTSRIGFLEEGKMDEVESAIHFALDLRSCTRERM